MTNETQAHRLYRSRSQRMLAGVCGGIAQYFGMDPTLVRLGFIALSFFFHPMLLVYLLLLIVVPEEPLV